MRAEVLIAQTHDVIIARSKKEYLLRRNHITNILALSRYHSTRALLT